MYDIIGDIHGYAKTLENLLIRLGYKMDKGFYAHPERKVIFVGDFIDRGPAILESLRLVKAMVDNGSALAVMGNHEYNAICFNTPTRNNSGWLRERSPKNIKQHHVTIEAFKDYATEWETYCEWFLTLPVYIELGNLRIVHAFWNNQMIENLHDQLKGNLLNDNFLHRSALKGSYEYYLIENILKGFELPLPANITYFDKDGIERTNIRVKWWKRLDNETYHSISVKADHGVPHMAIADDVLGSIPVYPHLEVPVFIGHYWNSGIPQVLAHNVCCVDYSIARREKLVAYRWNGESVLLTENLVSQECVDDE